MLRLGRNNRKLDHGIAAAVGVVTVLTLDQVRDLEPEELVEERDLVAEEGDELVRIPDALSCGHCGRRLHTLVETLEPLLTRAPPDLGQARLDSVLGIIFLVLESRLQVGNAVDGLKSSVDPAASTDVAETEGLHLSI